MSTKYSLSGSLPILLGMVTSLFLLHGLGLTGNNFHNRPPSLSSDDNNPSTTYPNNDPPTTQTQPQTIPIPIPSIPKHRIKAKEVEDVHLTKIPSYLDLSVFGKKTNVTIFGQPVLKGQILTFDLPTRTLTWCEAAFPPAGIGNRLHQYWYAR